MSLIGFMLVFMSVFQGYEDFISGDLLGFIINSIVFSSWIIICVVNLYELIKGVNDGTK